MDNNICRICGKELDNLKNTNRIINGYPIFQCNDCRTFFVFPIDSDTNNSKVYNALFSTGDYEQHRKEFELLKVGKEVLGVRRQQIIKNVENKTNGRKLIEIGGGTGSFGIYCKKRKWEYVDYDISSAATDYAKMLGLTAYTIGDSNNPVFPTADVIVMWEVIEHIWNVRDYLTAIKKALLPNGFFVFSTPNYLRHGYQSSNSWGSLSGPPVHVNFFTKESIYHALREVGFSKIDVIEPRIYRPEINVKSLYHNFQIAIGNEPTKTLFVIAQ